MDVQKIFEAVADKNGTSPESVRQEIALAIQTAMDDASPHAQQFWHNFPQHEEPLTPDELVIYLAARLHLTRSFQTT